MSSPATGVESPQTISNDTVWIKRQPNDYTTFVLVGLTLVGLMLVHLQIRRTSQSLIMGAAVHNAEMFCDVIANCRRIDGLEADTRVRDHGIDATHDEETKPGAKSPTVSSSMQLANRIGAEQHGATARLYSDYSFPLQEDGDPQYKFQRDALQSVRREPAKPFYRFDKVAGQRVLRYAVRDSHQQSPNTDWNERDVGGVLIVTMPLDATVATVHAGMRGMTLLTSGLGLIGILGVATVVAKHRRHWERILQTQQALSKQKRDEELAQLELGKANLSLSKRAVELESAKKDALNMMQDAEASRIEVELKNGRLSDEIAQRKRIEEELREVRQEHLDSARQAGMAEIATGVLHNVGNVLNSVNVSANLVVNNLRDSRVTNLTKATALLHEHRNDLADFITRDPKGTRLPDYLVKLSARLADERGGLLREVESLSENVQHIKEIVQMQQSYARVESTKETLDVVNLLENAIKVNIRELHQNGIEIVRQYEEIPAIVSEKHKIIQILVNLIGNAKRAIQDGGGNRRLTLKARLDGDETIRIEVHDTGIGIPPENLGRIFTHGFTTKTDGHGFGLHSSALTAQELGGSLSGRSEGLGEGAVFTLILPIKEHSVPTSHEEEYAT